MYFFERLFGKIKSAEQQTPLPIIQAVQHLDEVDLLKVRGLTGKIDGRYTVTIPTGVKGESYVMVDQTDENLNRLKETHGEIKIYLQG